MPPIPVLGPPPAARWASSSTGSAIFWPISALGASFVVVVVVVTFAGTTMDTGVRLQRYILGEIAELAGFRALVGKTTVLIPLALSLVPGVEGAGGKDFAFGQLWTLFGTTN